MSKSGLPSSPKRRFALESTVPAAPRSARREYDSPGAEIRRPLFSTTSLVGDDGQHNDEPEVDMKSASSPIRHGDHRLGSGSPGFNSGTFFIGAIDAARHDPRVRGSEKIVAFLNCVDLQRTDPLKCPNKIPKYFILPFSFLSLLSFFHKFFLGFSV